MRLAAAHERSLATGNLIWRRDLIFGRGRSGSEAPNSGTSWRPSPGSIRKPVPPPAGSSPQQKQTIEPLRKSPLQTSPAALPNQASERVSPESGRVLLRHARKMPPLRGLLLLRRVHLA
jgi:hypothetical protein